MSDVPSLTVFQAHVVRWRDCILCPLCETRRKVVLARGSVPAYVVFVGEAPGESENVIGKPFCGPAGKLLDYIIAQALPGHVEVAEDGETETWVTDLPYAVTNLVACIPRDEDGGKVGKPPHDSVLACAPRLEEFLAMCRPKLVVAVGAEARGYLEPGIKGNPRVPPGARRIDIKHPAAILRENVTQRGLAIRRAVVTIASALSEDGTGAVLTTK
jgi:uracil-DNA glycosylase